MLVQLQQSDLEQAIKNYVLAMGLSRPVETITFTQTRKDGASIYADISLAPLTVGAQKEAPKLTPRECIVSENAPKDVTPEVQEIPVEDETEEAPTSIFG